MHYHNWPIRIYRFLFFWYIRVRSIINFYTCNMWTFDKTETTQFYFLFFFKPLRRETTYLNCLFISESHVTTYTWNYLAKIKRRGLGKSSLSFPQEEGLRIVFHISFFFFFPLRKQNILKICCFLLFLISFFRGDIKIRKYYTLSTFDLGRFHFATYGWKSNTLPSRGWIYYASPIKKWG
jgi:hypothetical protein